MTDSGRDVLRCGEVDRDRLRELLARYGLELRWVGDGEGIPGSHWGDSEAGLVGAAVHVRRDTPIHSLLHEAGHAIAMDGERRASLHTDAGGDDAEESAVCYLQVQLADELPGVGAARLMDDMDRWGYSFRLGSTRAWFEGDAEDARQWLVRHGLVDEGGRPSWRKRS
jgi:hypothetical protein